ncbi:disease resistance protein RGA5-like [Triticum dicoccoides]|uniref:disease resistance protein RGA5-like n=1 Tax=Triticum dicoccoides TaxID=85692 RepID=UPI000E794AFC|nr:disease resistance protein RGA5-like [Triticum dicoccoides]
MQVVTGAMGALIPKLFQLLSEEYKLQKGVKQDVEFLTKELPSMHEALRKVADVPRHQLDRQVKIWADEVRELSYVMEDVVDSFLASGEGSEPAANSNKLKELLKKMGNLLPKGKTRRKIAKKIKGIRLQVREVADRRDRYGVNDAVANLASAPTTVDPRLVALFKKETELVGIDAARDEIIKKLMDGDGDVPEQQLKILSIYGIGGLGKTTVAKVVHQGLQEKFMLKAFVSVGQKPDVKKVLRDIFLELDKEGYRKSNAQTLDEKQLIVELRELLENKRYFIVIDDIWDAEAWEIINCAFKDSNCGSKIITTTRSFEVARKSGEAYQLKPLSPGNSEKLLYMRLYGGRSKCPFDHPVEISEKIIQRCGGVPLAILTIASLLDGKEKEDWSKVYDSIGFGHGKNQVVDNTRKILLFSYYDLPYYLRPCLLYLSIYPEDYTVKKETLIWKWSAEGFIKEEPGIRQYELGERYFSELVNRSMIQPIWGGYGSCFVTGCRVHDLVLDMISLLSNEENFVRVWDVNDQRISCQSNARRLAIQKRVLEQDDSLANMCTPQLRSFSAIGCDIHVMPSLTSFGALRVLDMEDCSFNGDGSYHLDHLGSLLHLRYLGLWRIDKVPEKIGNLKFLQTLNLIYTTGNGIKELPQSFGLLRQLKRLHFEVAEGIVGMHLLGNLTSLEDLRLTFDTWSPEFVVELRKLTMLRNLNLSIMSHKGMDDSQVKALVKSLGKLKETQILGIYFGGYVSIGPQGWEGYVPPQQLREFLIRTEKDMLPAWINPSLVPNLTIWFNLKEVKARDMEILGSFPELVTLRLTDLLLGLSESQDFLPDVMGGLFPKLRYFSTPAPLRFLEGAMPSLESLDYCYLEVDQLKRDSSFVFEFGSWENLHSLQKVEVYFYSDAAQEKKDEAVVALELAANQHPNRPNLTVSKYRVWEKPIE